MSNPSPRKVGILIFREHAITLDVPLDPPYFSEILEDVRRCQTLPKDILDRLLLYPEHTLRYISFFDPVPISDLKSTVDGCTKLYDGGRFSMYFGSEFACYTKKEPFNGRFVQLAIDEPPSIAELASLDDQSVLDTKEILEYRRQRDLVILKDFHNWVAKVENEQSSRTFVLKLARPSEVSTHRKLKSLRSERSHIAQCLEIFEDLPVPAALILMPYYGLKIYYYHGPVDVFKQHRQLCSAVAFLHSHGIAHLDIKHTNVAVRDKPGPDGEEEGDVTLLDLDSAMEIQPGELIRGATGTDDHVAPEVQVWHTFDNGDPYDPYKADVWAVGEIIQTMSWRSPKPGSRFLDQLGTEMKDDDPTKRPSIHSALRRLESYRPTSRPVSVHSSSITGSIPLCHETFVC